MITNVWTPQNFNYNENFTILKFWWIFLSLEGVGGQVVKLVAAKVISQHRFFFALPYFLYNNLWNKIKIW